MGGLSFLSFLDTLNTQEGFSLLIHAEIWVDILASVEAAEYYVPVSNQETIVTFGYLGILKGFKLYTDMFLKDEDQFVPSGCAYLAETDQIRRWVTSKKMDLNAKPVFNR